MNGYFIKNRKVLAPLYKLVDHPVPKIKKEFGQIGEDIGLLFQLADDFIDITSTKKYEL